MPPGGVILCRSTVHGIRFFHVKFEPDTRGLRGGRGGWKMGMFDWKFKSWFWGKMAGGKKRWAGRLKNLPIWSPIWFGTLTYITIENIDQFISFLKMFMRGLLLHLKWSSMYRWSLVRFRCGMYLGHSIKSSSKVSEVVNLSVESPKTNAQ